VANFCSRSRGRERERNSGGDNGIDHDTAGRIFRNNFLSAEESMAKNYEDIYVLQKMRG